FNVRLHTDESNSMVSRVADALNDIIEMNEMLAREFNRISSIVGKEGKITQRAQIPNATGGWSTSVEAINMLISDLAQPTTEVARVIGAVAKGDLSQTMALEIDGRPLKGEFLRTGKIVNTMVE